MVAYCATTLQGATCANSRCAYNHDVFYCSPCGRSFPASLRVQHQNAPSHLRNVAAIGSPVPSTPRSPLSQSPFSDLPSAPIANAYRPSGRNTPAPVDPRVSVSDEGGLDFVVDGTGSADNPSFRSINHFIVIEKTDVKTGLAVQSMKLTPSPNPWCESVKSLHPSSHFLSAALLRVYSENRSTFKKARHERSRCHSRLRVSVLFEGP